MKHYSLFILLLFAFITPAHANSSDWAISEHAKIRLHSSVQNIGKTSELHGALEIDLADGWHTYWRVSGDSGLPPRLDWSASGNVDGVEVSYPAPTRKNEQGFYTFGYSDQVILPFTAQLVEQNVQTTLSLEGMIMICKDICIPQMLSAKLTLPAGGGESSDVALMIRGAVQNLPTEEMHEQLIIENVVVSADALVITIHAKDGIKDNLDIFPVAENFTLTLPPEITVKEDNRAMLKIEATPDIESINAALKGKKLSLTLVNGDNAIEKILQY